MERGVLYESRAKGSYKTGSDIDLCLLSEHIDEALLLKIASDLDDLLIPYKVDLCALHLLGHAELRKNIERDGVVFYER